MKMPSDEFKADLMCEIDDVFRVSDGNKICNLECTDEMIYFMKNNEEKIIHYVKQLYYKEERTKKQQGGLFEINT